MELDISVNKTVKDIIKHFKGEVRVQILFPQTLSKKVDLNVLNYCN